MKKLILIFVITTFFACDSSDDSIDTEDKQSFNPPTWIQGSWETEITDEANVKFTADNFCTVVSEVDACFKSVVDGSLGLITVENEKITDTDYEFTIKRPTNSTSFHYRKKTDSSIVLVVLNQETIVFTKQ